MISSNSARPPKPAAAAGGVQLYRHSLVLTARTAPGVEIRYVAADRPEPAPAKQEVLDALDRIRKALAEGRLASPVPWKGK